MHFIQNVGDYVGAEGLQILSRLAANQLLEVAFLEIPFERVDAGDAQHRRMKQAVDYVEGGDSGVSPLVGQVGQQFRQSKNLPTYFSNWRSTPATRRRAAAGEGLRPVPDSTACTCYRYHRGMAHYGPVAVEA